MDLRPDRSLRIVIRREVRRALFVVTVFGIFSNILILTAPIYMMQVFNRVLSSGSTETLILLTVIAAAAFLALSLIDAIRSRLITRIGIWVEARLYKSLLKSALDRSVEGRSLNTQPIRDLAHVRRFLSSPQILSLIDAPWVPFFILVLYVLHPWLGLVGLVTAVILMVVAILNERWSRPPSQRAQSGALDLLEQVESALKNAISVNALGMTKPLVSSWFQSNQDSAEFHLANSDRNTTLLGVTKFFRMFAQILVLGLGAYQILEGNLTPGAMIAGSILLGRALAPVEQSIGSWSGFVGARDAWKRLNNLLPSEDEDRAEPQQMPEPRGEIVLDNVWFSAGRGQEPILRAFNHRIEPGEVVGVIGETGTGKSVLCNLIAGAWAPTHGHVRLDGADIRIWQEEQRRRSVGFVPQEAPIFHASIFDNIARFQDDIEPETVFAAAKMAEAHRFISALPDGYQTIVGSRNLPLSTGQKQLIALARAIVGAPKVLVLDEPQAHLNRKGSLALAGIVRQFKNAGSTIIVADPSTDVMRYVDTLLFLEDGFIQYKGPRNRVLENLKQRRLTAS